MKAFLLGDRKTLGNRCVEVSLTAAVSARYQWFDALPNVPLLCSCKESALSQINAVFRAREAEGLTLDPHILSIGSVEVASAKVLSRGPAILLVTSMVQQINCITNAKASTTHAHACFGVAHDWR